MFDQRKRNQDLYEGAMAQVAYEGEQKGKREIFLNMLAKGIDIARISDLTGIPEEEVFVLAQNNLA